MTQIEFQVQGVEDILRGFAELPKGIQKKYLGAAVRAASKDEVRTVRSLTPRGPTGNLKRSVGFLLEKKKRATTATGVIGYRRDGDKKGFHAWWIENGVKDRMPKGRAFAVPAANVPSLFAEQRATNGTVFWQSVRGFEGTGKFAKWAESTLPRIKDKLENVLGDFLDKAIAEHDRRQLRKVR